MTSSSGSYTPWDSQRERRDRKLQREHFNNNGRPLPKFDEKHKYNQEGQQLPGKKNLKKSTLRHIIIKLSKDKETILERSKRAATYHVQGLYNKINSQSFTRSHGV